MPWERGIFLPWQIVAKIFIESGQLRTELAFSTRDLALSHWPTSHKCTGCGCRAAFLSTTSLGKFRHQFGIFTQLYFSVGFVSYLFHICFHPLFCLPPVWESSSTNLGFSLKCISQLDFFHICFHPLWLPHNLVSVTRMMRGWASHLNRHSRRPQERLTSRGTGR